MAGAVSFRRFGVGKVIGIAVVAPVVGLSLLQWVPADGVARADCVGGYEQGGYYPTECGGTDEGANGTGLGGVDSSGGQLEPYGGGGGTAAVVACETQFGSEDGLGTDNFECPNA